MGTWKDCKNMLIIRLDNMGDLIMSNAALQEIKSANGNCKITLLASEMAVPIIPYLGTVDDYIQYDAPWMKLSAHDTVASTEALIKTIKKRQFDSCIIFNVYSQNPMASIMLAYLAEIPLRAAYMRENPYTLLTHWIPDREPLFEVQHQIARDLELVRLLGISRSVNRLPSLIVPRGQLSNLIPLRRGKQIIVNCDVSEQKRRIPRTVAQQLTRQLLDSAFQVILVGKEYNEYLRSCFSEIVGKNLINLIGKTTIDDLLLLVAHADAVLTVNTGVAHIACALQKPTLVLYAQTNPQHIPWSQDTDFILYPVDPALRSKNTINSFVDKQNGSSGMTPLSVENIMDKLNSLLKHSSQKQTALEGRA